jgi:nitroreductase
METIYLRQSIRKYKSKIPEQDLIRKILQAGGQAPSGGNRQPWRFIIVKKEKTIELITMFSPGFAHHPTKPPVLLAICSISKDYGDGRNEQIKAMMDTYLAAENISLAAVALGLGTVMVRSFPEKEIKEILNVPEDVDLILLMGLGYSDEDPNKRRRSKKAIEEITFLEKYGERLTS